MKTKQSAFQWKDACGIFGLWNDNDFDTAHAIYSGLYGVQHRGQDAAGIAVVRDNKIIYEKRLGLLTEVFEENNLLPLIGARGGIGHVALLSSSELSISHVQPLVVEYEKGSIALAINGYLTNRVELVNRLKAEGIVLQKGSDVELISIILGRALRKTNDIHKAICHVMDEIQGAYALLFLFEDKIVAVRDPNGFKPLALGSMEKAFMVASETAVFDTLGAGFERDICPGEIVTIDSNGFTSYQTKENPYKNSSVCLFEYIYFARPDSLIDGSNVFLSRKEAGRILALEHPVEADCVVGVPDSGVVAAMGYAEALNLPYVMGIMKNRYIDRTFISPGQKRREREVGIKLNAVRNLLEGKRVVVVDDSIVRGTTSRFLAGMLRDLGGAKKVHMRVSSPPVKYPCRYGVGPKDVKKLMANRLNLAEMEKTIEVDSLRFISVEGLKASPIGAKGHFCSACFDGKYPL